MFTVYYVVLPSYSMSNVHNYTSKGLQLLSLLVNSKALLRKKINVGYRVQQRHIIHMHGPCIMTWFRLWPDHGTINNQ